MILTANRLGGQGSMQMGLAWASDMDKGQLSHETATPVSRKIRVASFSAIVRTRGASEAQLYTWTVRVRLVCGGLAKSGPVSKEPPRSDAIKYFKKHGEPLAVVMDSQDGN
jgi:hypothetical protein